VLVSFEDRAQMPGVAGLYAEGRIEARSTARLSIPAASILHDGDNAFAWRVTDGALQQVPLDLGVRDERTGRYAVDGGLAEGDTVLRHPGSTLKDGQAVELVDQRQSVTMTAEE
jgi:hypothetical protein